MRAQLSLDVARLLQAAEAGGSGGDSSLDAYILMQRIFPRAAPCTMIRAGRSATHPALSEIGIFGTFLGDGTRVFRNELAGHIVRTKVRAVRVVLRARTAC